jgi:hypothetical protein
VTRAAKPMPTTSVEKTSAAATTFRWVRRLAASSEKIVHDTLPQQGGKEESRWRGVGPAARSSRVDWLAQPMCYIWHKIVSAVLRELFQLCFSRCAGPLARHAGRIFAFRWGRTSKDAPAGSPGIKARMDGRLYSRRCDVNKPQLTIGYSAALTGEEKPRCKGGAGLSISGIINGTLHLSQPGACSWPWGNCMGETLQTREPLRRRAVEKPNHRHRWLLRACRERPCGCRPADKRDEFAPPHFGHGDFLPCRWRLRYRENQAAGDDARFAA